MNLDRGVVEGPKERLGGDKCGRDVVNAGTMQFNEQHGPPFTPQAWAVGERETFGRLETRSLP
jgi:hypothetical protein